MKNLPLKTESYRYIEQSFKQWLDVLGYAPQSVYGMPNCIREMLHYFETQGTTHISEINNKRIKQYYRELKMRPNLRRGGALSGNTLNKHLQAIQKFTDYLRQSGRLILPKLYIPKEPEDQKQITVLSTEEIQQLYKATYGYNEGTYLEPMNARDRAMLTVFYACGLRRNEGYHLDISDINFDRQVLHVRKGKNYKERFVPFNKTASNYLQEYLYDWRPFLVKDKRQEALFISQQYRRMGGQSLLLRLKILLQRTEIPQLQEKEIGLHTLRHSIATHLLSAGMQLDNIAKFLGHSSLESTQVYTHLAEEQNE
jgi:integrase/recombinase XerD